MISTDRDTLPSRDRTTLPISPETNLSASQHPEPSSPSRCLHIGIDVGSTTVKLAVLNDDNQIVYAKYQRHHTDVRACARDLFEGAATVLPTAQMTCAITGKSEAKRS